MQIDCIASDFATYREWLETWPQNATGYVCYSVPIRTAFDESVEPFSLTWFWDLLIDIYFLVDIVLVRGV